MTFMASIEPPSCPNAVKKRAEEQGEENVEAA
jgi:hypothetical protein